MVEILFIRHGETEWNAEGRLMNQLNSPLSELGLRQAARIADRLADEEFVALYSSDLGRAMQTAEAISKITGKEILPCEELRERSLGVFAGLTWDEVRVKYPVEFARYELDHQYRPPEGESAEDFHRRTIGFLTNLAERHEGQRIVVVSHGGVLDTIFRHVVGWTPGIWAPCHTPNAALNAFTVENGKWAIKTWGDVSHHRNAAR